MGTHMDLTMYNVTIHNDEAVTSPPWEFFCFGCLWNGIFWWLITSKMIFTFFCICPVLGHPWFCYSHGTHSYIFIETFHGRSWFHSLKILLLDAYPMKFHGGFFTFHNCFHLLLIFPLLVHSWLRYRPVTHSYNFIETFHACRYFLEGCLEGLLYVNNQGRGQIEGNLHRFVLPDLWYPVSHGHSMHFSWLRALS
jgi:hypothetical protein